MKIRWTPGARDDLRAILASIRRDRPDAATRMGARLRAAVVALEQHPEIGRIVPEFGDPALRERIVAPYRVSYRFDGSSIYIIALVHGRRSLDETEEG